MCHSFCIDSKVYCPLTRDINICSRVWQDVPSYTASSNIIRSIRLETVMTSQCVYKAQCSTIRKTNYGSSSACCVFFRTVRRGHCLISNLLRLGLSMSNNSYALLRVILCFSHTVTSVISDLSQSPNTFWFLPPRGFLVTLHISYHVIALHAGWHEDVPITNNGVPSFSFLHSCANPCFKMAHSARHNEWQITFFRLERPHRYEQQS